MQHPHRPHLLRQGFTLMEIAIVLVIVGLLVGTLAVGQHFIRSAQLRSMISEYDQYIKAITQFQDKYQALPGDMPNATTVIGAAANGDGDGRIGSITNIATGAQSTTAEWFAAWAHLKNAQLIDGSFTGTGTGAAAIPGTNVPASSVSGAGWTLNYYLQTATSAALWGDSYGHVLWFGGQTAAAATTSPIITTHEAYTIDTKLDDGNPGRGIIRAWRNDASSPTPNCVTASTQDLSVYRENASGNLCSLFFITRF